MSNTASKRIGLIGHPVAHSRSPAMQQAALDALRIPARYELWDTPADQLATRVASLRASDMLGANVTIPHKAAVAPLLDAIAPETDLAAGVVNTIVRTQTIAGARLTGYNTDVPALARILNEHDPAHEARRALILGAGGAAHAALEALRLHGAEAWIAARRPAVALAALERLWAREQAGDPFSVTWRTRALALDDSATLVAALAQSDILINATPVGTNDPTASPLPLALLAHLPASALVLDVVYSPPETALVLAARALGRRASGGLDMLLYQGAAAFELWTGQSAPLAIMRRALQAAP